VIRLRGHEPLRARAGGLEWIAGRWGGLPGLGEPGQEGTPMAGQLSPEEIVTPSVLEQQGQSNVQIAQALGVCEGTIRSHARPKHKPDGRANGPRKADPLAEPIAHWLAPGQPGDADAPPRPANVHALRDWLAAEHGYQGSYRSVLRFVRARHPKP